MAVFKKCEKCGKPAVYKSTKFINGKPFDRFFCEDHAAESSSYVQKTQESINQALKINETLKNVFESMGESAAIAFPKINCPTCGLSFEEYKRTLLLGCPDCYRAFEEFMITELRKFHGDVQHMGRHPEGSPSASALEPAKPSASAAVKPIPEPQEEPEEAMEKEEVEDAAPGIEELREQLKEAVEREDFARAAALRDQIRSFEKKRSA